MGYAARVMRSIVVDFVRRRMAERRGGNAVHVDLEAEIADVIPKKDLCTDALAEGKAPKPAEAN